MPEPKGRLVTPVGFDPSGKPVSLLTDSEGRLEVILALQTTAKARAYLSTTQSIAHATFTKILFDAESYDPGGNFDTANSRFVAPVAGMYMVAAAARITDATLVADKNYGLHIYVNGERVLETWQQASTATRLTIFTFDIIQLNAGDYVEIYIYQDSGGSVDLQADSLSTFVSIHLLSAS